METFEFGVAGIFWQPYGYAVYESTTNAAAGTVLGRPVGFDLAGSSFDLHQQFSVSNLGRISGTNTRTTINAVADYALNYNPDGLLDGYATGNFAVSRTFETKRNLPTQMKSAWAGTAPSASAQSEVRRHQSSHRRSLEFIYRHIQLYIIKRHD